MKGKKLLGLLLTVFLVSSLFAGCGKAKNTAADNSNTQDETKLTGDIEMWSTFNDNENKVLKEKIIPAFNVKYPGIKVKVTAMPSGDDYKKQILTAGMTGTTPDLARVDISDVAQYASQGYLLSVEDLSEFSEIKKNTYEGPMSASYYNGHYYGIPLDTNTKIAIYNKKLLSSVGYTEAPKTMEEFENLAVKLKAKGIKGIGIGGVGTWNTLPYYLSLGGKITNNDATKATGFLNSAESVKALEKIVEWNNNGLIANSLLGGEGTWEGFNDEHYAMIDDGPWWYSSNKDQKEVKDNVIFSAMPKGVGGSINLVGGEDTMIFKDSKSPKQAWIFAKFLASDEAQTIFASELGMMPVCKATGEKDVVKNNAVTKVYMEQLNSTWARLPHPKWSDISQVIQDAFETSIRKASTPQKALDDAASKVDLLLLEK